MNSELSPLIINILSVTLLSLPINAPIPAPIKVTPVPNIKPKIKTPAAFAPGANLSASSGQSPKPYQSSRTTTRVFTGSFIAARRSASRAISSLTPSISNITRPGLTLHAQ